MAARSARQSQGGHLSPEDGLTAPEVDWAVIDQIGDALVDHPRIDQVWVAQRPAGHGAEVPVLVIAIVAKGWWTDPERLLEEAACRLDLDCTLVVMGGWERDRKLAEAVRRAGIRLV